MGDILDKISIGAGLLNPFGGSPGGVPFRGDEGNGITQTKEIIASTVKFLSEALTPYEVLGQVISEPRRIQKSKIMNYFTTEFLGLDNEAEVREYMKVYVRVPMEHSSLPLTKALADVMSKAADEQGLVSQFISSAADAAITQLYPYFLSPLGDKENGIAAPPPKVGDIVKVKYTDPLRTQGIFVEVIERIQMLTDLQLETAYGDFLDPSGTSGGENLSSQELMDLMNVPIDSVFATDQGPRVPNVEELPRAPDEILNSLCKGKAIKLASGDTIETVILDNRYVPTHIAPYFVAMMLAGERELGKNWYLNSGLRVMYSKDRATAVEFNESTTATLSDASQCKNWNGNTMWKAGHASEPGTIGGVLVPPGSQQEAAEGNCSNKIVTNGPPNEYAYANCAPPTLNWWTLQKRGNHSWGEAVDMHLGGNLGLSTHGSDPSRMTRNYRWLSLNAYKFGFTRSVSSERWHWMFAPSGYDYVSRKTGNGPENFQFSRVKRNNPQWDGQFATAEYMDEYANPAGESIPEEEFPAEEEFSADSMYSPESTVTENEVGNDPCQGNS
jgi:hypothetical protein